MRQARGLEFENFEVIAGMLCLRRAKTDPPVTEDVGPAVAILSIGVVDQSLPDRISPSDDVDQNRSAVSIQIEPISEFW